MLFQSTSLGAHAAAGAFCFQDVSEEVPGFAFWCLEKIERNSLIISSNFHANPLAGARAVAVWSQKNQQKEFLSECALLCVFSIILFIFPQTVLALRGSYLSSKQQAIQPGIVFIEFSDLKRPLLELQPTDLHENLRRWSVSSAQSFPTIKTRIRALLRKRLGNKRRLRQHGHLERYSGKAFWTKRSSHERHNWPNLFIFFFIYFIYVCFRLFSCLLLRCIRDGQSMLPPSSTPRIRTTAGFWTPGAVSYTHLTLPTILLV